MFGVHKVEITFKSGAKVKIKCKEFTKNSSGPRFNWVDAGVPQLFFLNSDEVVAIRVLG